MGPEHSKETPHPTYLTQPISRFRGRVLAIAIAIQTLLIVGFVTGLEQKFLEATQTSFVTLVPTLEPRPKATPKPLPPPPPQPKKEKIVAEKIETPPPEPTPPPVEKPTPVPEKTAPEIVSPAPVVQAPVTLSSGPTAITTAPIPSTVVTPTTPPAPHVIAPPVSAPVSAPVSVPQAPPAPPPPPPVREQKKTVTITDLTILHNPNAAEYYPTFSKQIGEEGQVQLMVHVSETGRVEKAEVIQSSNSKRLDNAAIRLARDIEFKPYLVEGTAIRVMVKITIGFRLSR